MCVCDFTVMMHYVRTDDFVSMKWYCKEINIFFVVLHIGLLWQKIKKNVHSKNTSIETETNRNLNIFSVSLSYAIQLTKQHSIQTMTIHHIEISFIRNVIAIVRKELSRWLNSKWWCFIDWNPNGNNRDK